MAAVVGARRVRRRLFGAMRARAEPGARARAGSVCRRRRPRAGARLAHSWRSARPYPRRSPSPARGIGLRRRFEPRQPFDAQPGVASASASASAARSSAPSSRRSQKGRSQPRASSPAPKPPARLEGARGDEGVAAVERIELRPDAAQLLDVARGVERFEGQRAQQAPAPRPWRSPGAGQQPRGLDCLLRLLPQRVACRRNRSAWVRRATPVGSALSSSRARPASRSSSAHSAASRRAPSSAARAERSRASSSALDGAVAPARSCRRCALPAASRVAEHAELVVLNELRGCRPGSSGRWRGFCARL